MQSDGLKWFQLVVVYDSVVHTECAASPRLYKGNNVRVMIVQLCFVGVLYLNAALQISEYTCPFDCLIRLMCGSRVAPSIFSPLD